MTNYLIEGFREFRETYYNTPNSLMAKLVQEGQHPDYFIISCIDSRSNPGAVFNAKPGAFLGFRSMGAIVRPYSQGNALAAALQFAIKHADVRKIIVLGHTKCGAINALCTHLDDKEILSFVEVANQSLDKAKSYSKTEQEIRENTEKETVLQSVENLKTYPSVQEALEKGDIVIKPWLFDMVHGDLLEYDYDRKDFCIISN
ncbi:MAG: hypothetical protein OEY94_10840 [Alphaproteobacteria bacterium]|nr:hypothetical protein [Alphaproteobacteria bacterium]